MSEKRNSGKEKGNGLKTIVLLVLCLAVGGIVFFLSYKNETVSTTPLGNTVSYQGLICVRDRQSSDEILTTTEPVSVKETAKVIYRNDEFDRVSFTYEGEYATEAQATKAENELHSGYYIYLGKIGGIGVSDYPNNYSIIGNKVVMDLSSGRVDTPLAILKLFSYDLSVNVSAANEEEIVQNYTSKGFNCKKYNGEENK